MPDLQSNIEDFKSADTQVLGISVDSKFSHDNWANSLGGILFPLLADFHPKGAVAGQYGLYLEANGITDRATVIIDKEGIVQFAESAGIPGLRKAEDLLSECRRVNG